MSGDAGAQPRNYLEQMASLRFFAALLVVGCHLHLRNHTTNGILALIDVNVLWNGFVGVSIFYVLSGFVISYANDRWKGWKTYLIGRVARIYPAHLIVAFALCWYPMYHYFVVGGPGVALARIATNLALLQAWIPNPDYYESLNVVSWSLSVEMFFYVSFLLLRRLKDRHIYLLAAAGYALNLAAEIHMRHASFRMTYWEFYIFPVARLPEFLMGMSVYRLHKSGTLARLKLPRVDFLVIFGLMIAAIAIPRTYHGNPIYSYSSVPALFAMAMVTALLDERASPYMKHRYLVLLGESSFALYLTHLWFLTTQVRFEIDYPWANGVAAMLFLAAVAIGASVVFHLYIERPATKAVKRVLLKVFERPA